MSAGAAPDLVPRPRRVTQAVLLALASFALALLTAVPLLPYAASIPFPWFVLAFTIAACVLWLLLIRAIARGRNWARFVFAFFCLTSIPRVALLVAAQPPFPSVILVMNVLLALLNVLAAMLLFTPSASAWFGTAARAAPTA
jgi:hypothetical protein